MQNKYRPQAFHSEKFNVKITETKTTISINGIRITKKLINQCLTKQLDGEELIKQYIKMVVKYRDYQDSDCVSQTSKDFLAKAKEVFPTFGIANYSYQCLFTEMMKYKLQEIA
jgi:hypothetical protein